jgi:hypothetical protein
MGRRRRRELCTERRRSEEEGEEGDRTGMEATQKRQGTEGTRERVRIEPLRRTGREARDRGEKEDRIVGALI